jgi:peptidoglycan/LPS O-acetylase OafA/YrhL/ABC-type polysaccharide transport system permease subunit
MAGAGAFPVDAPRMRPKTPRALTRSMTAPSIPRSRRRPVHEPRLPYVYLAPALVVLGVFGLLPVLFTVVMSLFRWDSIQGFGAITFGGLDNFVWIFVDDDWFGGALGNALWHTAVAGVLVHASAIPLAAFIDQAFRRWRAGVLALYFLPFLTSGIVIFVVVSTLFSGSENGVVNSALLALGNAEVLGVKPLAMFFPTRPVQWLFDHGDAVDVLIAWWHGLGWNVLLYVTALQYVPKVLLEAARIDGANAWQTLRHITVPQLRPMIFFAASLTVVAGISSEAPRSLAGYMEFMAYNQGDYGASAAMAVVVLLVLAGLVYFLWAQIGGRPALPRSARPGARVDDRPRRKSWGSLLWAWLRRTLESPESGDPNALRGFDGMRGMACLLVIAHHLSQRLDGDRTLLWVFKPLWSVLIRPGMGVCLFVVLSGALLSMPFWTRYLDGDRPPPLGRYALRRAARIAPGYWVALGASTLLGLALVPEAPHALRRFLAGATFTSGFHWITLFPSELNPVLWTISFEVTCYVLLPLLVVPMWHVLPDRAPRRALRYLAWVLVGLQLAHLAIVAIFPTDDAGKGWHHGLLGGAKEWLPYWSPASFMTQFMLGGAAALAICWKRRVQPRRSADFDRLGAWALLGALVLHGMFGGGVNSITRQPYITPVFPALLALGMFAMQFGDRLPRWMDNRLFRWAGKYSFGLFVWHYPILELIRLRWVPSFKPFQMRSIGLWLGLSALAVAGAIVLAWLSWHLVEQPALRWAKSRHPRAGALPREALR